MATIHPTAQRRPSRLRTAIGLGALAEVVVYVLVASWIGLGATLLLTLVTSALGALLLARQGRAALGELRLRAEEHRAPGRALGDAGLVALGGLLMVLPVSSATCSACCACCRSPGRCRGRSSPGCCCAPCPTGCVARCTSARCAPSPSPARPSRSAPVRPPVSSRARSLPDGGPRCP